MPIYCRCYVTQEFIGFFYNVDRSMICRAIQRIEKPARSLFGVRRKPVVSRKEAEALIVDCTEQQIQRPGDNAVQKEHYSYCVINSADLSPSARCRNKGRKAHRRKSAR